MTKGLKQHIFLYFIKHVTLFYMVCKMPMTLLKCTISISPTNNFVQCQWILYYKQDVHVVLYYIFLHTHTHTHELYFNLVDTWQQAAPSQQTVFMSHLYCCAFITVLQCVCAVSFIPFSLRTTWYYTVMYDNVGRLATWWLVPHPTQCDIIASLISCPICNELFSYVNESIMNTSKETEHE